MNFQNLGLFASVTDGQARTDSGTPYAVRAPGAAFRSTFRPILSSTPGLVHDMHNTTNSTFISWHVIIVLQNSVFECLSHMPYAAAITSLPQLPRPVCSDSEDMAYFPNGELKRCDTPCLGCQCREAAAV